MHSKFFDLLRQQTLLTSKLNIMITAFSTNDVNDINQVLSDESFDRNELYDVWNALEDYRDKILNQDNEDSIIRAVKIQKTIDKIKYLIEIDLEND